jgi:plasmid maintenance system antidote protein VapI
LTFADSEDYYKTMQYRSAEEITEELRSRISYEVSQKDVAAEIGVTDSYLSEVLADKKRIGEKIIKALGYETTPYYRRKGRDR